MSEKKYQVFVSSTYEDLKKERQAAMNAILEVDCFPIGMELFPATGKEQFEYIKTLIEESDFYVLIVAGRYGSVDEYGVSYTEKEHDYAIEKGIPVISFIKEDESISKENTQEDKIKELNEFIKKVKSGKMVKEFNSVEDLQYKISTSINKNKKIYNRPGWIRGNKKNDSEYLNELNDLRKQLEEKNEKIELLNMGKKEMNENSQVEEIDNLENNLVSIRYYLRVDENSFNYVWNSSLKIIEDQDWETNFKDLTKLICEKLFNSKSMRRDDIEEYFNELIKNVLSKKEKREKYHLIFKSAENKSFMDYEFREGLNEGKINLSIDSEAINFILMSLETKNIISNGQGDYFITEYGKSIYNQILKGEIQRVEY